MDQFEQIAKSLRSQLVEDGKSFLDTTLLLNNAKALGLIEGHRDVADVDLPDDGAQWIAEERVIVIRDSVQLGAQAEEPRARFTIVHELAHALLRHPTRNRRASGTFQHGRNVEQDEANADALALAILAPMHLIIAHNLTSAKEIASEFGITLWHAEQRLIRLQKSPEYAAQRRAYVARSTATFDSGDHFAAMAQMARNARRWNS